MSEKSGDALKNAGGVLQRIFGRGNGRSKLDGPRDRVDLMYWDQEEEFAEVYSTAFAKCGSGPKDRYYVLKELLLSLPELTADTAECGVFRGLGTWMISHYSEKLQRRPQHRHHCFDSFAGLSAPKAEDSPEREDVRPWHAGDMAAGLSDVQRALACFSGIEFHCGWIPDCFSGCESLQFSFVHIDVDLYEPTRDALAYFYPRMVNGGMILFDDYGHLTCPGAKRAVDDFVGAHAQRLIRLTSGQSYLVKTIKQDGGALPGFMGWRYEFPRYGRR